MKPLLWGLMLGLFLQLGGCKDSGTLESITVTPEAQSVDLYADPIQYTATGNYTDDSTADLTDEVEWTVDSTSDNLFSTNVPGLLSPRTQGSWILVATFPTADSSSDIIGYTTLRITTATE